MVKVGPSQVTVGPIHASVYQLRIKLADPIEARVDLIISRIGPIEVIWPN